jgi:23S rRNA (uracil1939-C5)-methyltransferase
MKIKAPVEKNQVYTVEVEDLTYQGMGVAKIEHFPIFIADSIPGEKIETKITKVQKNFAFGRVEKVLEESPDRVEGNNAAYTQTGIAPLQHITYDAQLKFKQTQITNLLKKSHLEEIEVADTVGMENPTGYRNKAQIPVRRIKGQLETGFFKRSSHDLVPIEDFYIQDPVIDQVIVKVRDILREYKVQPYDEINNKGVIRNIMVRRGRRSGQIMVVLITRTKEVPNLAAITEAITAIDGVVSVIQNVNYKQTNVIMGEEDHVLAGESVIHDELLGQDFIISAHSFYQVNPIQTEKLYQLAIDKAGLTGEETVIDVYSGIGTISLAMAQAAKKVYGVEIVKEAVQDAKINAFQNGAENTEFVVGKAEEQMQKWQAEGLKPDVVVVDPPRKGLDQSVIDATVEMAPNRVVYVSCNPATLVRDIERFTEQGYHVDQPIVPVDQFPQTPHVESVTVLSK